MIEPAKEKISMRKINRVGIIFLKLSWVDAEYRMVAGLFCSPTKAGAEEYYFPKVFIWAFR